MAGQQAAAASPKHLPKIHWDPNAGSIPLRDGRQLDVTSCEWSVPTTSKNIVIDWGKLLVVEGPHRNSIRRWVAHKLRTKAPVSAGAAFTQATALFNSPAFLEAALHGNDVPYLAFSQAAASLGNSERWQLHYSRDYYRWCEAQRFPFFIRDVAVKLNDVVIGGNVKGAAVRSADPDKGPLDAMEASSIALALRAARIDGTMPLREQSALWLCLAFGANPAQCAALREEDIRPELVNGQLALTLVSMPRHKKGHIHARTEFQTRKANRFVGKVLLDLIAENRALHESESGRARPLFWRDAPLDRGSELDEWSWHIQALEFTRLVQRAVKRLRVLSRAGSPLRINTRRFRYSLASRMVQEGASKWAVAVALDHSDLQNVNTYFDVDDRIVEAIDTAMAMQLGARAQAFAQIVDKEEDAVNGNLKGSRRYYGDREKQIFEPVGSCGHNFICNVVALFGCYICPKFQAWADAPHDLVLDHLIEERVKRIELGLDERIVGLEDELIAAVASVIIRISDPDEKAA